MRMDMGRLIPRMDTASTALRRLMRIMALQQLRIRTTIMHIITMRMNSRRFVLRVPPFRC
jgi:hypothetical protein